ncbi:MAG: mercuric reductase [Planctomycetes bacterium]|nr:mercuric reductase [Planctomycetota bacterium]
MTLPENPPVEPMDAHNRELLENARPDSWKNPEPKDRYNLVVIGAGAAGLVTAAGAAGLGARVALVERHLMGGDCLNVGCVPSKALLASSRAAADARRAAEFGVRIGGPVTVDFPAVMERLRRLRAQIAPNDSVRRFTGLGVDVFLGQARFARPGEVEVDGLTLRYARAVIATGARASAPPIPGLAETGFLTNETLFNLTALPPRLAVIGAGPIGCEMAQAFARLGSQVTLLEVAPAILGREDPDAAALVREALEHDGVRIETGVQIARSWRDGEAKLLELTGKDGARQIAADAILVGAGRKPNVEGLNLEAVGVEYDPREGVRVDDTLRTTSRAIFAAGDICSKFKFTHMADALARIVIRNALFFGNARASALNVPWCTYTDPEIAHVGLYGREAEERGIPVHTIEVDLAEVDRAILDGDGGLLKVHVRRGTDRILGATLVSRHAGETISEISVAMAAGAGLGTLASTIHPYPTQAEALRKAGDLWNRTRLTPFVKGLMRKILEWRR